MVITALQKKRGRLYRLFLDGEEAATIDMQTMDESPYRVGSVLSDEELEELIRVSYRRRTREKAMYLLSMRDHSRAELEKKLRRDGDVQAATEAVDQMEAYGWINDAAYAHRLARDLGERKLYPPRRILQELQIKGIARDVAEEAVEAAGLDEGEQALALLRKKYYNRLVTSDQRQRTIAALARYGFSYEAIRTALHSWDEECSQADPDGNLI